MTSGYMPMRLPAWKDFFYASIFSGVKREDATHRLPSSR